MKYPHDSQMQLKMIHARHLHVTVARTKVEVVLWHDKRECETAWVDPHGTVKVPAVVAEALVGLGLQENAVARMVDGGGGNCCGGDGACTEEAEKLVH